ncbi:MAG: elongator complex protein 3 [Solirubrobacterales bacterium]
MTRANILPVFIPHAGCPGRCSYCDQWTITGRSRPVEPDEVGKQLASAIAAARAPLEVAFYGGSFTALPEILQEAYLQQVQSFRQQGRVTGIRVSTQPDAIDRETLSRLIHYGVTTVELGVQSLDSSVLLAARRTYEPSQVGEASLLIRQAGLRFGHQLMPGLPESSWDKDLRTGFRSAAMKPDMVRLYPALVLAGTELAELYQTGRYHPLSIEEAALRSACLFAIFASRGIPVIRMGLQREEGLENPERLLAGPYHPRFGEIVLETLVRRQAARLWHQAAFAGQQDVTISVHPRQISQLLGPNHTNLRQIEKDLGIERLIPAVDETLAYGSVALKVENRIETMMRAEFLQREAQAAASPYRGENDGGNQNN